MVNGSHWGLTPRQSIERECARRGTDAVVAGCLRLLSGDADDPALLLALGGPPATKFLDGARHADTYWFRVWALRGLLWAAEPGDAAVQQAVAAAFADEAWRVREMAVRVAARHRLSDLTEPVAQLRADPVPRVARVASRALPRLVAVAG